MAAHQSVQKPVQTETEYQSMSNGSELEAFAALIPAYHRSIQKMCRLENPIVQQYCMLYREAASHSIYEVSGIT